MERYGWIWVLLIVVVIVACVVVVAVYSKRGEDEKPSVKVLSPFDSHSIVLGEILEVESRVNDDDGISRVELRVNDSLVHTASVPAGEKSFRVLQSWQPTAVGAYNVAVIAYDTDNKASKPEMFSVIVNPAGVSTLPPPVDATGTPMPTGEPAQPTDTPTNLGPDGCTYDAKFVADVTIPDNTEMAPGTEFVKTWRLRNSGTCNWGEGFIFVFIGGEQMGAPAMVNVPPTQAGATVDVSVLFRAPQDHGTFRSRWRLRTPGGQEFGDRPFVQIVVPPPATATPQVTPTATAAPKPDLEIVSVEGDLELLVGESLELLVTVRNHGPGATDKPALVRAILWVGVEPESSVTTLAPGDQGTALLAYTFDAPTELDVSIFVDPNDKIIEENELNNVTRISVVVDPSLYASRTITVTPNLGFDLDDGVGDPAALDAEWRAVEGSVYLGLQNGAGAAPLSGEAENISYGLVSGLSWETEQLLLDDLVVGRLFGFRTSAGRVGYARVQEVLDATRTSAKLTYWVWDWP